MLSLFFNFSYILLFKLADKSDRAVDDKKDSRDKNEHGNEITEGEKHAEEDSCDGVNKLGDILFLALEDLVEGDRALDSKKHTENDKYDAREEPTKQDNCRADNDAHAAVYPVFLNAVKNTEHDEDRANSSHYPLKHASAEDRKKKSNNDKQDRRKQLRIFKINFLCHYIFSFLWPKDGIAARIYSIIFLSSFQYADKNFLPKFGIFLGEISPF